MDFLKDSDFWRGFCISIIMIGCIIMGIVAINLYHKRIIRMAELGYQQQSLIGQSYTYWQKVK